MTGEVALWVIISAMGAVPKKKPSKTRARHRHSAWEASQIQAQPQDTIACPQCGTQRLAHRACPDCGYYKDNQVVEPKAQVKKVT